MAHILPCQCGSTPCPSGDGATPDDGWRTLWCQGCLKHVTEWHASEREAVDHWNEERELDTGSTARYSQEQADEIALAATNQHQTRRRAA